MSASLPYAELKRKQKLRRQIRLGSLEGFACNIGTEYAIQSTKFQKECWKVPQHDITPKQIKTYLLIAILSGGISILEMNSAYGQDKATFRTICAGCHTIGGGPRTGPDLKNVEKRQKRDWLIQFIKNSKKVIDGGDPYATKLFTDYRKSVMPPNPTMSTATVEALLDLIKTESAKETSEFAGEQLTDVTFTAEDVGRGREYYTGRMLFANGGPPCISCHDVTGLSGFGGGQLGPDLTNVFEKKQFPNRNALFTWLSAPGTATMLPIYKNHALKKEEVVALVAFLESTSEQHDAAVATSSANINFFLLGLGGTVAALVLFDVIWKRRFRTVRRALVQQNKVEPQMSPQTH